MRILLLIVLCAQIACAQNYFSNRINISGKYNQARRLLFVNDTFVATALVNEVAFSQISASLLKIDKFGSLFLAKRFKPSNRSYTGAGGICKINKKYYTTGITDWGLQLQNGLYTFDQYCDTVFTRSYGDTTFYNLTTEVRPFLKDKSKLVLFGSTDSTCGINHPGFYKPLVRLVDTNGVLYQTRIYTNTNFYRTLSDVDTTIKKGYVLCGTEVINFTSSGTAKNYVIKIDSNLNQVWYKYIDTSNSFYSSIISLKSGQLIYAHNHSDFNASNTYLGERIVLTKLDISGNIIWRKTYGGTENSPGVSKIKECSNGDYILCGEKYVNYTASVNQYMGWIMRTDSMGNLKWWRTYIPENPIKDTTTQNELHDILELPNKDIACVGWAGASGFNSLVQQTWILKVDSNGCFGASNCPQNIVSSVKESTLNETNLKVYPNPANDLLNIELNFEVGGNTNVILTNSIGQIISNGKIESKQSKFDISAVPNGIYFVNLKHGGSSITKKVIIQH